MPQASSQPLPRTFYARDPATVARELLGKILVHGDAAGRIVETEAYLGRDDRAAHSFAGLTPRTRVLFGPPGRAYVYLSYGMHCCLNLAVEPRAGPAACCCALEPVAGLEAMFRRRHRARLPRELCSGPGKLTQALAVTLDCYGADVTRGPLTVREPEAAEPFDIVVTPRIGITRDADLPLRFFIRDNEHVSRR